jgi:mandelate racemase
LQEPFLVREGFIEIPDRPGSGLEWDKAAVKRYRYDA